MGRPAPFMIFRNMIDLNVQDTDRVIKVGDTMEDIREGLNAKRWGLPILCMSGRPFREPYFAGGSATLFSKESVP